MTVIPGFSFSNTDWVSGIIWPVISGLDTTATVTVPVALLLPPVAPALPVLEPPPLEQAAAIVASASAQPAAASFLEEKEDLDELINEPPRR